MTQINRSSIIFSSLICGCLLHSFVEAAQPAPKYSYKEDKKPNSNHSFFKAEKPAPVSTVQANKNNARQIEAGGIGYSRGYTTLEAFLTPIKTFDSWLPFVDLRGHRFDSGIYAFNTGLGLRYLSSSNCTIWGANVYYDYRQADRVNFKQIGCGLEALGAHWDYRINGYIPFGKRESGYYHPKFKEFKGNNLIVNVKRKFDMYGANAEAAYHWMPSKESELTVALGPYYFQGKFHKFAAGGQARLKATFCNAVSIEGIGSYDNLFKWKGQGQVAFSIPLGPKLKTKGIANSECDTKPALDLSLVRPVQRFEIIVADSHKQSKVAIDPGTGIPLHFIFVDNDPSSTPNGTAENPFVTMAQAQAGSSPGDIIYVFGSPILYGPATAGGNVITLQNNQQFLGSGIAQPFKTTLGTVHAPATTYPMLSNGAAASNTIVTLGNNNIVSGFSFPQVDAPVAIFGSQISNATIQENTFNCVCTGSEEITIGFGQCSGTISVMNNTMTSSDSGLTNFTAIQIVPDDAIPGVYNIIGNNFIGNGTGSNSTFLNYNSLIGGQGTTTYPDQMNVIGNTITSWPRGAAVAHLSTSSAEASFQFAGNIFNTASSVGIGMSVGTTGSCNVAVSDNSFISTALNSIGINVKSHGAVQIDTNTFIETTGAHSFRVSTDPNTASACVQLNYNVFDQSVALTAFTGSQFILQTPIGNTGPVPTESGPVTTLPLGQTCH